MASEEELRSMIERDACLLVQARENLRNLIASNEKLQQKLDKFQRYHDAIEWLKEASGVYNQLKMYQNKKVPMEKVQLFFNENFKIEQAAKKELKEAYDDLPSMQEDEK